MIHKLRRHVGMAKVFSKESWSMLKETFNKWNDLSPFQLSAALSYYTIFSLPSVLVLIISISGLIFGQEAVRGEIYDQFKDLIGPDGAAQVQELVQKASSNKNTFLATVISIGTLVFSATACFLQLQSSLNHIWNVEPKPGSAIIKFLLDRVFTFGLIVTVGFLLMISLVISSLLAAFNTWLVAHLSWIGSILVNILNNAVSLGIYVILFALIFKVLPDAKIRWKDVWVGSLVTALLFAIGKFGIGFYLGTSNPGSAYGAAGSIILILLWVSYSSLIVFFGAVFTNVYTQRYGPGIQPSAYAVKKEIITKEIVVEKGEALEKK